MGKAVIPGHTCRSPPWDAARDGGLSFPHNIVFCPYFPSIHLLVLVMGVLVSLGERQEDPLDGSPVHTWHCKYVINHIDLFSSLVYRAMRCQTKSVFVTLIRSSSVCQALFPPWFCVAILLLLFFEHRINFSFLSAAFLHPLVEVDIVNSPIVRFFWCFFPHECVAMSQYLWQQWQFVFLSLCSQKLRINLSEKIVLPPKSTYNNSMDYFSITTLPVISRCSVKFRQWTKYTKQSECFHVFSTFVFF